MMKILIFLCLILSLSACAERGRIGVILDNSNSMVESGTSFDTIKQTVVNTLQLALSSHEIGLRVFHNGGSLLVAPYQHDLDNLKMQLALIRPDEGTFIGQSLLDTADDIIQGNVSNNHIIMITDGKGSTSDVEAAQQVRSKLSGKAFKCSFILFSKRQNVLNETPIGEVAKTLG